MTRPKAEINWDKVNTALAYNASLKDAAEYAGCSDETLKKHIRDNYKMGFLEYRDKKMAGTRLKLIQKALKMADSGNVTMLIFCLKNLCDWADKKETTITGEKLDITFSKKA